MEIALLFCEQIYLTARISVPTLSCEASMCQGNSALCIHCPPVQCLVLQKIFARLWGFIYTSFLKAFDTYIKHISATSTLRLKILQVFSNITIPCIAFNIWPYVYFVSHQSLVNYTIFPWILQYSPHRRRRQWHPTPVLLPGKSHEWWSLVGCSPWRR